MSKIVFAVHIKVKDVFTQFHSCLSIFYLVSFKGREERNCLISILMDLCGSVDYSVLFCKCNCCNISQNQTENLQSDY